MEHPPITFKNSGEKVRNDIIYDQQVFVLVSREYTFTITPKTKFWRFGIRFSKKRKITYDLTDGNRHRDSELKDLHISVGHPSPPGVWEHSNRLELTQYHFSDPDIINRCETYKELTPVTLKIKYDKHLEVLSVSCASDTCDPYTTNLKLFGYKYFKISAWADLVAFDLECKIEEQLFDSPTEHDPNEIDESDSNSDPLTIGGLVASDDTEWFETAIQVLQRNKFVTLWWDKLPSGSNSSVKTTELLRNTIRKNGFFEIYYTKSKMVHYRAVIKDFSLEDDYNAAEWRRKYPGIALQNSFSQYEDEKGDSGMRNARIVFVADILEKVKPEFSVDNFVFLSGFSPPIHNNLQPYVSLNNDGTINQNSKKIIYIEGARSYNITNDFEGAIGVKELAAEMFELIKNLKDPTGNMIGIFGQWGRGKTFFWKRMLDHVQPKTTPVKLTRKEMWLRIRQFFSFKGKQPKTAPDVLYEPVEFHAWKYQDTPASWAYLYENLSDKYIGSGMFMPLIKRFWLNKTRHGYRPLLTFFTIFGLSLILTFAVSLDTKISFICSVIASFGITLIKLIWTYYRFKPKAIDIFNMYSEKVSYNQYLGIQAEIQKEIIYLLKSWISEKKLDQRKILIFVDDIDRCDEERIIKVIDSFKVMLEDEAIAKRLVVIMAIDERVLKMAIKKKYFDLVSKNCDPDNNQTIQIQLDLLAKEYIDKLFIAGIKLADLSKSEQREIFEGITRGKVNFSRQETETGTRQTQEIKGAARIVESVEAQTTQDAYIGSAPEIITGDDKFEIEENEYKNLLSAIENYVGLTPRAEKIFYYRYLLAKRIMKLRFPKGSSIYSQWHSTGMDKSILANMLIKYASAHKIDDELAFEKSRCYAEKGSLDVDIYQNKYKLNSDLYYQLLKVVETVVPY
jgi:hypothetical protein